jgi:integrase
MSAKRRVEFTIDDEKYFSIFQEYLRYLEEKKVKYFFPKISQEQKVLKKEVQKLNFFLQCNPIIQEITGRYASLHSFRHTYATKSMCRLLMQEEKNKSDLYNLVNMLGHLGPDVTLRYYVHIDYVLHYLDLELF